MDLKSGGLESSTDGGSREQLKMLNVEDGRALFHDPIDQRLVVMAGDKEPSAGLEVVMSPFEETHRPIEMLNGLEQCYQVEILFRFEALIWTIEDAGAQNGFGAICCLAGGFDSLDIESQVSTLSKKRSVTAADVQERIARAEES